MNKTLINNFIRNLTKAKLVSKVTPWVFEGQGDKNLNVRYLGLKLDDSWKDIMSLENNLLLKFYLDKNNGWVEIYLANKPPFIKLMSQTLHEKSKWEIVLGKLKNFLSKEKEAYLKHADTIDNLYNKIKPYLK